MPFLVSPGVAVVEKDFSSIVPAVSSSTGAFAGPFSWGPVNSPLRISSENELVAKLGKPTDANYQSFFSAANFLAYTNTLYVNRTDADGLVNASTVQSGPVNSGDISITVQGSGYTAAETLTATVTFSAPSVGGSPATGTLMWEEYDAINGLWRVSGIQLTSGGTGYTVPPSVTISTPAAGTGAQAAVSKIVKTGVKIKNIDDYLENFGSHLHNGEFAAKYAGSRANGVMVYVIDANNWSAQSAEIKKQFAGAPGTSDYASARSGSNDEIHVIVIDEDGLITGTPNTILERFAHVSVASDAKTSDGSSNYVKDVINNRSQYIYFGTWEQDADSDGVADATAIITNAGSTAASTTFAAGNTSAITYSLSGGADSGTLTTAEYATGFDLFEDIDTITVDFLIAPGMTSSGNQVTVVNDLATIAGSTRKDCIVVTSPARADIVNSATPNASAITTANSFTYSSYIVIDNNYLKVYDKYNDQYVFIPAASSTAGIIAATDVNAAPWFSPAGPRRGQYLGIVALAYSPTKAERDSLYKAGINPISNIPGQGVLLYGDKTHMNRPSAFDRINVRRLFLVLERAIAAAAKGILFEFNDEFTRAEFTNIVEPVLREVKGRRGIYDFKVVCDETNNTPAVIDRNEFIASIFVKPARSINYITLNFVAVRTGVEFEEVVGQV